MMKSIFTLILILTFGTNCFGQTKVEINKISNFKNDPLSELNKPDTLQLSTTMLIRERFRDVRIITTFPKSEKIKLVEYYFNDTKILESNYSYKQPNGELTGITKQYNKKGQLEYIQDHDKGTWKVVQFDNYPYYKKLVSIKGKVDSLIISNYGKDFFDNYVIWSPEGSAFYNGNGAGATWTWHQEWEPKEYLIRYSIRLSETEIYDDQIEVHLNEKGEVSFPFDSYKDIKGFEKLQNKKGFILNKKKAIELSSKLGLIENDTNKAFTLLTWQYNKEHKKEMFNGSFTYDVAINTQTITHAHIKGRNRIEYKFDVYIFNPWTGEFIEKRKMKSFREWEKDSGMFTGLMPDE